MTAIEPLTKTQRRLIGLVIAGAVVIAGIGFAGSYAAVSQLAEAKHFGWYSLVFPIGIDAGIAVMLALDLVLTSLRMPFPLLRQAAWFLTAATVMFNASSARGDVLAAGMHATIPTLFIVTMEAARFAVARIAKITANRFIESPPFIRWFIDPVSTFRIWRCMRLWQLTSYEEVIVRQRELAAFRTRLRARHGLLYRRRVSEAELLALRLARFGTPVAEALAIPEAEAEAARQAEAARDAEAKRKAEAEAEARREAEAREAEAAARLRVVEAETAAALAAVEEQRRLDAARTEAELQRMAFEQAEAEAARKRRAEEAEAEALRTQRAAARTEAPRQAKPKAEPNPKPDKPKPKQPAELTGRRAQVEAEVEAVLRLIRAEGYDEVGLERVKADFNLKHGAAYDRLAKARERFRSAKAVDDNHPLTGTDS